MSLGKVVKQLIASLQSKEAGAEALCDAFVPLLKRQKNSNQVSEILEAIEKKEHKTIWTAIFRHMEAIISELEVNENRFDPIGSSVFKLGESDEQIFGRVVSLIQGESDELVCEVTYEDGSEEQFPFTDCKTRIVFDENNDDDVQNKKNMLSSASLNEDIVINGFSVESVEALNAVASFAYAWISYRGPSGLMRLDAPEPMLNAVIVLHDILFNLSGLDGVACQESIARVCEVWWTDERPGAELLVPQLLPYLLMHGLSDDGTLSDVKRLYVMRGALLLLDFEDESIETLKGLLVRCAMHPRFIGGSKSKSGGDFGKKFLIFLFGLHPRLVDSLHATIKNQLPLASPAVLKVYGDIYLRAWRASDPSVSSEPNVPTSSANQAVGVYRRSIETCLQEIMNVSIHAASTSMHTRCREVLLPLHEGRNVGGCDAMLYKLWEPIMFRALNVANPLVRSNAVSMLSDAFPLGTHQRSPSPPVPKSKGKQSSSFDEEASEDELLQKQFDALMSLLEDCDPRVRASAASATCNILLNYWEAIPSNTSKSLLITITSKCARDKTSNYVRAAAVSGIGSLLEQPLCHPVLKALLPSMHYLIHDNSEKVRHAMVSLLQRVSTVRSIKFFQVVTVEQLHARLAFDYNKQCLTTSSALVRLFVPSYLPDMSDSEENERDQIHLKRCLAFLKSSPKAGLAFYSLAREHVALDVMINLIELLFSYAQTLSIHIDEQMTSKLTEKNDQEEDDDDVDDQAPPTPDKRSKRKHRGKKKQNMKSSQIQSKVSEDVETKQKLVALCLECSCNIYESILSSSSSKRKSNSCDSLVEKLVDVEEGIPALYQLLSGNSNWAQSRNALLRLSACLPTQHINALGPFLFEVLGRCVSTESLGDLTPAVSLLCKSGFADSVSTLIKESLEAELKNKKESIHNDQNDNNNDDDDKEGNGKRKRNRKRGVPNKAGDKGQKEENGVFPYPLTLKILNSISLGSDSLCQQARLNIIQNEDAIETIVSTLNLLKTSLFDICLTSVNNYSCTQVSMFVESIELFGRILTHINVEKRQSDHNNNDDDVGDGGDESKNTRPKEESLSHEMEELVHWAINDLLPLTIDHNHVSSSSTMKTTPQSPNPALKKIQETNEDDAKVNSVLSPPMKAFRANGTSPINSKSGLAIAATSSSFTSTSSETCHVEGSVIASEVIAIVLSLASDWTACGMNLKFLSSVAEQCAMYLINTSELNKVANHNENDQEGNDVTVNENMGGVLCALGRLTYQLAVQETQGAKCPTSALSLLLRSAHLELSSPSSSLSSSTTLTSSSSSSSTPFNTLRHDNKNQDIVHGYFLQLLTLATRRGTDTLNRLVHYFINIMIEHSMVSIPKDEEIELDDLATSCLTPSGQAVLATILKHRKGSKAFISVLLEHHLSVPSGTSNMTTDDIHEMKPAQLLFHSLCGELRLKSATDKNSASLLKWTIELPSFPGKKPASPVGVKLVSSSVAIISN